MRETEIINATEIADKNVLPATSFPSRSSSRRVEVERTRVVPLMSKIDPTLGLVCSRNQFLKVHIVKLRRMSTQL
jgi:hypothetical protein